MALVAKIVSSAAIPVVLVVGTSGGGLLVLDHAGEASRRALARVAPVVRQTGESRETLAALARLHARWNALGDARYADAWRSRMASLDGHVAELGALVETAAERRRLAKVRRAVARHRDLVLTADGARFRERTVAAARRARTAGARAQRALDAVAVEVQGTAERAQAHAGAVALRAQNAMLGGAFLAGVLALLSSSLVGRRVARGLALLTDASVALERGRLDQAVAIGGRDELARLAVAFEALAAGLVERDRVCEDTIRRLGHDVVGPLESICEATRALASEVSALPIREQTLVLLIGEAAEDLLRRAGRIGDDPSRPEPPAALVRALPSPRPAPALLGFEKRP